MVKVRIKEIADELGIKSKEVVGSSRRERWCSG